MIITCASCLTKFHLDDSRIPSKGAKVRCSRCRHVFHAFPADETGEEAKGGDDRETLTTAGPKETERPFGIEEEEMRDPILPEKLPPVELKRKEKEEKEEEQGKPKKEEIRGKVFTAKKSVQDERKGVSSFLIRLVIGVLVVLVAFYLLTELGAGGRLFPYVQSPIEKIAEFIRKIF